MISLNREWLNRIHFGDCLETLRRMPSGLVNTCVTSPPYFGLRDYGHPGQIGLEETPEEFIGKLVEVFREVRRVLRDDGTAWINMGDSYARNPAKGGSGPGGKNAAYSDSYGRAAGARAGGAADLPVRASVSGVKEKDLLGIPWMLAFALRADGWYLRKEIIWHKPNPMPESVTDRPTKAHEHIFLLAKSPTYYYDHEAIKEPAKDWSRGGPGTGIENTAERYGAGNGGNAGLASLAAKYKDGSQDQTRNRRSVWTVPTKAYKGAHFATYPEELIEPCVLAGAPPGGVVLDPFMGSGTTARVAQRLGREWIGCELNENYAPLQDERTNVTLGLPL